MFKLLRYALLDAGAGAGAGATPFSCCGDMLLGVRYKRPQPASSGSLGILWRTLK